MLSRSLLKRFGLLAIFICLVGCRGAAETVDQSNEVPASPFSSATPAQSALPIPSGPPLVENDSPAGACEGTANILSRVDRAPKAMFRAVALDNRVGPSDGDGIRLVRFIVLGDGFEYLRDEETAPYCILGGNEPDCGDWSRNERGRYTWGEGGPAVEPGRYDVFVEIVGESPDSLSGSDSCNWSFALQITSP